MYIANKICLHPSKSITVRVEEMSSSNPNDDEIVNVSIKDYEFDADREFYITKLNTPIVKGKFYRISMEFVSSLNDNLKGFYRSNFKNEAGVTE